MAHMLQMETPSRIMRRIEAGEEKSMPSLPSMPVFDDSADISENPAQQSSSDSENLSDFSAPITSTPAHSSAAPSTRITLSAAGSLSSQRFAASLARSSASKTYGSSRAQSASRVTLSRADSFEIEPIPTLPYIHHSHLEHEDTDDILGSTSSVPDMYLPSQQDGADYDYEKSIADALEPISRAPSPSLPQDFSHEVTPRKNYDYSLSLRSEPRASPLDPLRNIVTRRPRPMAGRRTPSLTRSEISSPSSPANSTPHSMKSIALPRSTTASPSLMPEGLVPTRSATTSPTGQTREQTEEIHQSIVSHSSTEVRSMDITDIHISPGGTQLPHDSIATDEPTASHEPTFSDSEGGIQQYSMSDSIKQLSKDLRSPKGRPSISSVLSSPGFSLATPTPAFPRPTRFNMPTSQHENVVITPPPITDAEQHYDDYGPTESEEEHDTPIPSEDETGDGDGNLQGLPDGPLTPHARRRSFLLSVINSTARPRPRFGKPATPHPRANPIPISPSLDTTENTPLPARSGNLQVAFARVTPKPGNLFYPGSGGRKGLHPLSQTPIATDSPSPLASPVEYPKTPLPIWTTPRPTPGYDSDRASFISTTSSHDLTTHARANTSFDPAMGFTGNGGGGVGRFNAGKLNNYLHGLNRRLQEENEVLTARIIALEEETSVPPSGESRRSSLGMKNRRVSAGGTELPDVLEEGSEGWLEEKAELENMVEELKLDVDRAEERNAVVQKALKEEKDDRAKEKEKMRQRLSDVEKGVQQIVGDLEKKLSDAETRYERIKRDTEGELLSAQSERDSAVARAEKAESVLESGRELGGELKEANTRVEQVLSDLRNANVQIRQLEDEVVHQDQKIEDVEHALQDAEASAKKIEREANMDRQGVSQMEQQLDKVTQDLQLTKDFARELEETAEEAGTQVISLQNELANVNGELEQFKVAENLSSQRIEALEVELHRTQQQLEQTEQALDETEKKLDEDEDQLAALQGQVHSLEKEKERLQERSFRHDDTNNLFTTGPTDGDVEALENELDDAHREIGRLTAHLNQSPARKAVDMAKEAKIEMLEREREDLLERNKALRRTFNDISTPNKMMNATGISPIHRHVLSMSMRAPKTPGGPLPEMSWLNMTTSDSGIAPLVAEISRLQQELDYANESIDDKIDKLEEAGLGVVGLTRKLEDARAKISALEDEMARLSRTEDRRIHQLQRLRCQKCRVKIETDRILNDESSLDISVSHLPLEPPTPPTRTSEALRKDLQSVTSQLARMKHEWETERKLLLGEKAALQDAASRLNSQLNSGNVKLAEKENVAEELRTGLQGELQNAKDIIADLEADLKNERSRLRTLSVEQDRVHREKENVFTQLQRTESDMDDVKQQLNKFKQDNRELEHELRVNSNAEQKARILEARVAENLDAIDQLRQERSFLAQDYRDLQTQFSTLSDHAKQVNDKHTTSQVSHDTRRHKLDLQLLELDDLRRALSERGAELKRVESENQRIAVQKSDMARSVQNLEADLKRVRRDAEAFGRDLKILRTDKDRMEIVHGEEIQKIERAKKQTQTEIRVLNEQLESQRQRASEAREELRTHVCAADSTGLIVLKQQHNRECKGLIVQIKYLKAKFTRESCLRVDLAYQKQYLLVHLSQFEKSEKTIFAAIARIGGVNNNDDDDDEGIEPRRERRRRRQKPKLKSVAMMVLFLCRVGKISDRWREQCASKQAIVAALQEVRRKRGEKS